MTKDPLPKNEAKPVRKTGDSDEAKTKPEAEISASPPPVESRRSGTQQPIPTQGEDETDRKQDEAIDSLADQTEWIKKQTRWIAAQVIASSLLSAVTLGVLVYHGWIMRTQSQAMTAQTGIMKGQLESMNSSSTQTQEMIDAMQKQAAASQTVADENRDLVESAGEQAKASLAQAEATRRHAEIAQQSFYIGERPYVWPRNAVIDKFEVGATPNITIMFENSGKTPAFDLQVGAIFGIGKSPEPNVEEIMRLTPAELAALDRKASRYGLNAPNSKTPLAAGGQTGNVIRGTQLTDELMNEIKSHQKFLFVWGGGLYKDGLGNRHKFLFCLFYDADEDNFVTCPTFNQTR